MAAIRNVLFKRNFFLLWFGQIISEFGDRLNQMALIALVYSKSPGSVIALAKLLFFVIIPVFLIGPLAGAYVDRWDRKKVMITADILRGMIVSTLPFFVGKDLILPVYIAVFATFSATRFFIPAKMAFIPVIVPKEKLVVANSLSSTTRMLATILGFALAGFIVAWIGYINSFYLDSLSYFVSAAFIAGISAKNAVREKEEIAKTIRLNILNDIWDGILYVVKKDKMSLVASTLFLMMAGAGSIFCVIIVFVQGAFGSGTKELGMLGVFLGAGLLTGALLFGKFGQKACGIKTIFTSFTGCGLGIVTFALYASRENPVFTITGLLIALIGVFASPIMICVNTLIHNLVPDKAQGRVFSSVEIVMHLGFILFMFLTAYLARYVSNANILILCGVVFSLAGLAGRRTLRAPADLIGAA